MKICITTFCRHCFVEEQASIHCTRYTLRLPSTYKDDVYIVSLFNTQAMYTLHKVYIASFFHIQGQCIHCISLQHTSNVYIAQGIHCVFLPHTRTMYTLHLSSTYKQFIHCTRYTLRLSSTYKDNVYFASLFNTQASFFHIQGQCIHCISLPHTSNVYIAQGILFVPLVYIASFFHIQGQRIHCISLQHTSVFLPHTRTMYTLHLSSTYKQFIHCTRYTLRPPGIH